jgi:hypothetical protein
MTTTFCDEFCGLCPDCVASLRALEQDERMFWLSRGESVPPEPDEVSGDEWDTGDEE